MNRKTNYFPLKGGDNYSDSALSISTGELISSSNYEVVDSGYKRIDGFERFSGKPKPSDLLIADYDNSAAWIAAMEVRRTAISAVAGKGNILGVWYYNNKTYAFRNNAGDTAAIMWESSSTGWVQVVMNYRLDFTAGTSEIQVGDTIEGAVSGATATISKIFIESGDWSTNDAAGRMCFKPATLTGNFDIAENIEVSSVASATNTAQEYLMTLPPNGRYEFINYNFYGHSSSLMMHGVNGVGNAFIFDGTDIWFIDTGMTTDTPNHIFAFRKHLFLSFAGGSVQHSSIGVPDEFSAITGASEIAIGDECVGFDLAASDAMLIMGRNSTKLLYGDSSNDWNLVSYSEDNGGVEWSIQRLAYPIYLDDRGVTDLQTTQAYGDFKSASISKNIDPLLNRLRGTLIGSLRVRNKDQYRMFFSGGTNITMTFLEGKFAGATRQDLGKTVYCSCSSETTSGEEILFFGSDDGYIYQMDKGNNFDGEIVNAYIRPAFNHLKSPEHIKRFTKVVLEVDSDQPSELMFVPSYDYSGGISGNESTMNITGGGGFLDEDLWDNFYYDSAVISSAYGYLQGIGKNFSLYIRSALQYEKTHTLQGIIIHYSIKGLSK